MRYCGRARHKAFICGGNSVFAVVSHSVKAKYEFIVSKIENHCNKVYYLLNESLRHHPCF